MADKTLATNLYNKALELLTRREHSQQELSTKLLSKCSAEQKRENDCPALIAQLCERLVEQGYLSDERFAKSFVNARMNRGQGHLRIAQELHHKGIASDLIETVLAPLREHYASSDAIHSVWLKKFGAPPQTPQAKAKQMRFLLYRGFDHNQVSEFFSSLKQNH